MTDAMTMQSSESPVEAILRDELAHGDVVLGTIGPVLGHLLANHDHSLFSDEIVSRVRGMVAHLARQIAAAHAETTENPAGEDADFSGSLLANERLVSHCHALALEWQLTARLESRSGIDPVLSPLLQALIASDDAPTASAAMATLASQARFVQSQRRMELPLGELPADLFQQVVLTWVESLDDAGRASAAPTIDRLRTQFDESAGRLGLLARLVAGMGAGARAALSIGHSGVAIFLSSLATMAGVERDLAIVSTNDRQLARLALMLRAAGQKPIEVEEQFLIIHPDISLPDGFNDLRADRANSLLTASGRTSAV